MRVPCLALGCLAAASSAVAGVRAADRVQLIRVGLESLGVAQEVTLTSLTPFAAFDPDSHKVLAEWEAGEAAKVRLDAGSLQVGRLSAPALYFSAEGPTLKVAGPSSTREYRGWIQLSIRGSRIWPVNELPLEAYLTGVLPCELGASNPLEALKAQAVAARTYALSRIGDFVKEGCDLVDNTRAQTYRGATAEAERTNEAVRQTANQILVFDGRPISALYATVSGGVTASAREAFGSEVPYLRSVPDVDESGKPFATGAKYFEWEASFTQVQVSDLLQKAGLFTGPVTDLRIDGTTESGRVAAVVVVGPVSDRRIPATSLRAALGVNVLRSTFFTLERTPDGWKLRGRGWGHGVGMCQAGAVGRAKAGQDYKQILAAYYPGAQLITVPGSALTLANRGGVTRQKYVGKR